MLQTSLLLMKSLNKTETHFYISALCFQRRSFSFLFVDLYKCALRLIQLTLVISTSLISNNSISRSENFHGNLTTRSKILWKEKLLLFFSTIFSIISNLRSQITYSFIKCCCFIFSANLICRPTDISKYFRQSLGLRDKESRLY